MAYNRPPYQSYNDTNSNQPYPVVGYPQDLPYQGDFPSTLPYDSYAYPMNPYGEQEYRGEIPLRGDTWDEFPRDYPPARDLDEDVGMSDYPEMSSERPRGSWAERNERETEPSFKRDDTRGRRHEPYRSRKHVERQVPPRNMDPYTLDHIVPFNYFCEWYKQTNARSLSRNTEINKDELQDSFIKYRDDLLSRTAKAFVKEHMNEEWFKEKYDPVLGTKTRQKLINYRKWLYEKFMQDLDAGKFDELTLDGAAARRYFAEKSGKTQSPPQKDEEEETTSTLAKMPHDPMAERKTPCIKTISTTVSRTQLEDLLEDMAGFKYLSVSDPNPSKKFARVGWVIVDDPANPEEVVSILNDQRIRDEIHGDFVVHTALHAPSKEQPRKALSDLHSTKESLTRDLNLVELVATKKFEKQMGEGYAGFQRIKDHVNKLLAKDGKMDTVKDDDEEGAIKEDDESLVEIKKVLDLTIEYFRRVYSFCFYCVSENDSVHELQRKCFAGHFRRPPPEIAAAIMQKAWNDKMDLLINPEEADVIKLGGINVDEAVKKEIDGAVKREAEDRWRCGVTKCTKLFLEEKFVRSHIQKRHRDWLERLTLEAELLNRYVVDPCRILPPSVEQPPAGFGAKHHPDKEYGASTRIESQPSMMPAFTGFPTFALGQAPVFDNWSMGYDAPMRVDDRPPFRGRRGGGGGPMRRGMDGPRDHPYERRSGWTERRDPGESGGYPIERNRVRETRPLRSYRDLDAPQEATPELNY